jgi:predicted DNA-binding transcriptional regulator AlpA
MQKLLTETETAQLLHCTKAALRRWRRERRGPKWIPLESRLIRYRESDLEDYLNQNAQNTAHNGKRRFAVISS